MFGVSTNQVVIRPNAKQFPKVTKGDRSISLEAKVAVVMSGSQVTAFTEKHMSGRASRDIKALK